MIEASRITNHLYQGSAPLEGSAARDAGFDLVVLCARELQDLRLDGVEVLRCPLDDVGNFVPGVVGLTQGEWLRAQAVARRVAEAIASGRRCLVTCAAGRNRSGLVVALVLHFLYGWSGDRCIQCVRACRPNALTNDYFVAALREIR